MDATITKGTATVNIIDAVKLLLSRRFKVEYIGYQSDYGDSSQRFYHISYPKDRGPVHKTIIKVSTTALISIAKSEFKIKQGETERVGAFI